MATFIIRDFQRDDLLSIKTALMSTASRSALYCLATGGGKTVTAGFMIKAAAEAGKTVWFLTHRKEIADQTGKTFKAMGMRFGMIMTGTNVRPRANIQIGMVQTVARRLDKLDPPDLIVFDEAHHTAATQWQAIYDAYPKAYKVGLSATPERLDGKGLDTFFAKLVMGKDTAQLISEGYLSPYKMFAPTVPDTSELHIRAGDFKKEELDELIGNNAIIGNVVDTYIKLAMGKKTILFAPTVKTSEKFVAAFLDAGIKAVHVDGKTNKAEREKTTQAYHDGEWDIMSNVGLFGEGYDVPDTECIIDTSPTMSLVNVKQRWGRALRPIYHPDMPTSTDEGRIEAIAAGKKPYALLLDHAGNCFRHGLPCDEVEWSLAPRKKGTKKLTDDSGGMKQCPKCWAAVKQHIKECECGHIWVVVSQGRQEVEGNLEEISKEQVEQMKKDEQKKKKNEQVSAKTLEELIKLGAERGYKNPRSWATYIFKSRKAKEDLKAKKAPPPKPAEIKMKRNIDKPTNLKTGTVMFAYPDEDKKGEKDFALTKAKEYIEGNELSNEQVKLVRRGGCIMVVTKKEFVF